MSTSDREVLLFVAPWIAFGFVAALTLAFLLDVRGAIIAFCIGALAPALAYVLPNDLLSALGPLGLALKALRTSIPFNLAMTGPNGFLIELPMDWWIGAMVGATLGLCARRQRA